MRWTWRSWAVLLGLGLLLVLAATVHAAPLMDDDIIHIVRAGETLSSIAQQYGVTVTELVEANRLTNANAIYVGQKLRIPRTGGAHTTGKRSRTIHVVQPGETLSSIAAQYGVSIEAIALASNISVDSILRVGQKLTIPGEEPEPSESSQAPQPTPEPTPQIYVVRPGDTLSSIAERFNTSVVALARANNLSSPSVVFVGRRLIIPQPKVKQPIGAGKRVEVSISRQRCYVYEGDVLLYEWVCSTGRASSPTKPGTYYVQSKMRKAFGSAWNIWMPYWLGLYWAGGTENGFHGLPWNATTGQPTWAGLVGTRVTFGCVMLSNENAKTLWDIAYIGMPVIIRY